VPPEREELAPSALRPTPVREGSQTGTLPRVPPPPPEEPTQVEPLTDLNPPIPPPIPPPTPPPIPAPRPIQGRREDTRPIAISDDEERPGRAPHEQTRPINMPERRGGDEIDRLAHEWGLSDEKLARSLKRARPRIVEATAELERLLLKPPKPPALSRAEATEQLAALLERRSARSTREPNGKGSARDHGERNGERSDEPNDSAAAEAARGLQRAPGQ
jgi:hypothetical protein